MISLRGRGDGGVVRTTLTDGPTSTGCAARGWKEIQEVLHEAGLSGTRGRPGTLSCAADPGVIRQAGRATRQSYSGVRKTR